MTNDDANSAYYATFVQLSNNGAVFCDDMEHTVDRRLTDKEIQDRKAWSKTLPALRDHYHAGNSNRINATVNNPEMILNQRLAAPNLSRKQASPRSGEPEQRRRKYPKRIEPWSDFGREVAQYRLTTQQNSFKVDVKSSGAIFSNSIMALRGKVVDESGEREWLLNQLRGALELAGLLAVDAFACSAVGRPDFALHRFNTAQGSDDDSVSVDETFSVDSQTLICEAKSTQNLCLPVGADRTAAVYNTEATAAEENGGVPSTIQWANVCLPLGQLFCYMIENRRRHGALTSGTRTYYCRIQVDDDGSVKFLVSDAWFLGQDKYLRAWAYLQKLACDDLNDDYQEKQDVWTDIVSIVGGTTPHKRSTRSSKKQDSSPPPTAARQSKRLCGGRSSCRTDDTEKSACDQFCVPNDLDGMVPIVSYMDVQVQDVIGDGKNGAAFKALWCGREVARKQFDLEKGGLKAFQKEASAYAKLQRVWGELVPSPLFVCESATGCIVFLGLQLGRPFAEDDDVELMYDVVKKIRDDHGIELLDVRTSNFVFLANEDGTERLVAIDLEDHEPAFVDESDDDSSREMD